MEYRVLTGLDVAGFLRIKARQQLSTEVLADYSRFAEQGYSMGVYDNHQLVALALAEKRERSKSLWIWEFYVASSYRRRGIGKTLMNEMVHLAQHNGFACVALEIESINLSCIRFCEAIGMEAESGGSSVYIKRHLS